MSLGPAGLVLATVVGLAAAAAGQADLAKIATVQLPAEHTVRAAALGDLNGDGREDLVVAASRPLAGRPRVLLAWLEPADGRPMGGPPDLQLDVTADVVAFALGDVHGDPGTEVVLFTASSVFAWRTSADAKNRLVKLAAGDFLFQYSSPSRLFTFPSAVEDLDRDGLADLVIPEPGGYRLAWQKRDPAGAATFERSVRLEIPPETQPVLASEEAGAFHLRQRGGRARVEVRLPFATEEQERWSPYLKVEDATPSAHLRDWDGDGDLDLFAQTETHLLVWIQDEGRFTAAPHFTFPLPVKADRSRRLDVSYSAHLTDLDLDGRADCVMIAGDQQAKDIRTQVLVYLQGQGQGREAQTADAPLFGPEGLPQDLLVLAGFAGIPDLVDVDGDGRPDLCVAIVRPDLIDRLRDSADKKIEGQIHVWLTQGPKFPRQPSLTFRVAVPAEAMRGARTRMTARFFADVTGDGLCELLVRGEPDRLRLYATRAGGRSALTIAETPIWELRVDPESDLVLRRRSGQKTPAILVLEDRQVLVVRFGP